MHRDVSNFQWTQLLKLSLRDSHSVSCVLSLYLLVSPFCSSLYGLHIQVAFIQVKQDNHQQFYTFLLPA